MRLGDKLEFGLTALWGDEEQAPPGEAGSTDLGHGSGAAYLRARLEEHRRDEAARARAAVLANDLDMALSAHAIEQRRTLLPTPRIPVRAACLVDRESIRAFQAAFEAVREQHPEVRLLLTGPWPPYSFVTREETHGTSTALFDSLTGKQMPTRAEPTTSS
jgi:hypothetical protein